MISFLLNDRLTELQNLDPNTTVLEYLREVLHSTGTKEGCASGDCGACTVIVGEAAAGEMVYRSINACVTLIASLHGKQLITVEDLSDENGLHPVQVALVKHHGSQCGFCTPGFIMSLFGLWKSSRSKAPTREAAIQALGGNLCRCTGYRPILDAAIEVCGQAADDKFDAVQSDVLALLSTIPAEGELKIDCSRIQIPRDESQLAQALANTPEGRLVAGGTDLMLEITQENKHLPALIYIGGIPSLQTIERNQDWFQIGAAATLDAVQRHIATDYPDFDFLLDRLGSLQIRNTATLAGNLANASPIGDTPPVLLALGAKLQVASLQGRREIPIDAFFLGYRKTALCPGEYIARVDFPAHDQKHQLKVYKVSKRMEDDISAVCVAFYLRMDGDTIGSIKIAYGGMAAVPARALATEVAMTGMQIDAMSPDQISAALAQDFQPIDDARASANYRLTLAVNLVRRLCIELSPDAQATQVFKATSEVCY